MPRSILAFSFLVALSCAAQAATPPEQLSYQGVLRDSAGAPITGAQEMRFRFFSDAVAGDEILVDEHLAAGTGAVPVDNGLFQVAIGGGAVADGSGPGSYTSLAPVFRDYSTVFVEIRIGAETLSPRIQVRSAAFALNSSHLEGKNIADITGDTVGLIGAHAADDAAHHPRYTDGEAVTAMGAKTDSNPLHHDRRTDAEIAAAASTGTLSGGQANAFEIVDEWGDAWDGVNRPARTYAEAAAACAADGGRLPTATEIFRNNAGSDLATFATTSGTDNLWTFLRSGSSARAAVRLSDGVATSQSEATAGAFRCIWPAVTPAAFDDNACHAAPGGGCATLDSRFNIDDVQRATVNYLTAMEECEFEGGRLPDLRQMEQLMRSGAVGDNTFQWLNNLIFRSGHFVALLRWDGPGEPHESYENNLGSFGNNLSSFSFRCLGLRPDTTAIPESSPACQDGCYTTTVAGVSIQADSTDRTAATQATAFETCRSLGGSLPRASEYTPLVRSGWASGSNTFLWSSEPDLSGSNRVYRTYRFSGTGDSTYVPTDTASAFFSTSSLAYRCVWRGALETSPTVCAADEEQSWDGSQFSCATSTDGSSSGQALPVEFVDGWGNAWDTILRPAADFTDAESTCQGLGGRLPTATEIWRVRNGNGLVTAIGGGTETSLAWTLAPHTATAARSTIRVSDGATSSSGEGSLLPFRCIWPGSSGDVLGGRACYGAPVDSCFQGGRLRIDRFDRPQLVQAAAADECRRSGGRLPVLDELQELIHAGAPNGSNNFLWMTHPLGDASANRRMALARWTGAGTTSWDWDNNDGSFTFSTSPFSFRCVYSDRVD